MTQSYTLDTGIYPQHILQQALSDFSDSADMSLLDSTLSISAESSEEISEIFHEYMNYCIGLIHQ